MNISGSLALTLGAVLSALAVLAHVACVLIGPDAYRFLGAGERMARAVEAGSPRPALMTLGIAAMLLVWAAYALSAAGHLQRLPLIKPVLLLITTVYLARGLAFPFLRPMFPENSMTFWWVSSSVCLLIGLLHAHGLASRWSSF